MPCEWSMIKWRPWRERKVWWPVTPFGWPVHSPVASWVQCRVGCGIKMGQERYTAQISVPTTVVHRPAQYFPYNTSTMVSATPQCFGGKIMCLVPTTTLPAARLSPYLDRIWRGTNWKSPKYAHVPILPLQSSNQCDTIPMPFPVKEMPFTIKPLGSVSPVHTDKLLGTTGPESIICAQCLDFPTNPIYISERHDNVVLGKV